MNNSCIRKADYPFELFCNLGGHKNRLERRNLRQKSPCNSDHIQLSAWKTFPFCWRPNRGLRISNLVATSICCLRAKFGSKTKHVYNILMASKLSVSKFPAKICLTTLRKISLSLHKISKRRTDFTIWKSQKFLEEKVLILDQSSSEEEQRLSLAPTFYYSFFLSLFTISSKNGQ